ncbi:hypothetical protein Glove_551g14 [Diversispora epigaea]|uniref:CCHC-type domain-containing protein n=1 Tax=Diversispora epigaea TaxID=1348612 RepID=A0A397GBR3_9GLOM|nr:hypothetical protein Glove_551g14 [Diversispora epigaea]
MNNLVVTIKKLCTQIQKNKDYIAYLEKEHTMRDDEIDILRVQVNDLKIRLRKVEANVQSKKRNLSAVKLQLEEITTNTPVFNLITDIRTNVKLLADSGDNDLLINEINNYQIQIKLKLTQIRNGCYTFENENNLPINNNQTGMVGYELKKFNRYSNEDPEEHIEKFRLWLVGSRIDVGIGHANRINTHAQANLDVVQRRTALQLGAQALNQANEQVDNAVVVAVLFGSTVQGSDPVGRFYFNLHRLARLARIKKILDELLPKLEKIERYTAEQLSGAYLHLNSDSVPSSKSHGKNNYSNNTASTQSTFSKSQEDQSNQITLSQNDFKKLMASLKGNNTNLPREDYDYDPIEDLRLQFEGLKINQAKIAQVIYVILKSSQYKCSKCNKTGHNSRNCPKNKRKNKSSCSNKSKSKKKGKINTAIVNSSSNSDFDTNSSDNEFNSGSGSDYSENDLIEVEITKIINAIKAKKKWMAWDQENDKHLTFYCNLEKFPSSTRTELMVILTVIPKKSDSNQLSCTFKTSHSNPNTSNKDHTERSFAVKLLNGELPVILKSFKAPTSNITLQTIDKLSDQNYETNKRAR